MSGEKSGIGLVYPGLMWGYCIREKSIKNKNKGWQDAVEYVAWVWVMLAYGKIPSNTTDLEKGGTNAMARTVCREIKLSLLYSRIFALNPCCLTLCLVFHKLTSQSFLGLSSKKHSMASIGLPNLYRWQIDTFLSLALYFLAGYKANFLATFKCL